MSLVKFQGADTKKIELNVSEKTCSTAFLLLIWQETMSYGGTLLSKPMAKRNLLLNDK